MKWGRQNYYCPNCGRRLYAATTANRPQQLCCSDQCREEWERKYVRSILGKDEEEER